MTLVVGSGARACSSFDKIGIERSSEARSGLGDAELFGDDVVRALHPETLRPPNCSA